MPYRTLPRTTSCALCHESFTSTWSGQLYCSVKCRNKVNRVSQRSNRKLYYAAHREEKSSKDMLRRRARVDFGLCLCCSKPLHSDLGQFCEKHWFSNRAVCNLGTARLGPALKDLLTKQVSECPYSGVKLLPGRNCHLDHVLPKKRFPHLRGSVENVEWVHSLINQMKGALSREEFIAVCRLVVSKTEKVSVNVSGEEILLDSNRWRNSFGGKKHA